MITLSPLVTPGYHIWQRKMAAAANEYGHQQGHKTGSLSTPGGRILTWQWKTVLEGRNVKLQLPAAFK